MSDQSPKGWEPDPRRMGGWQSMFDSPERTGPRTTGRETEAHNGPLETDDADLDDAAEYRPWTMTRGSPAMLLHLRVFEERSGIWKGWMLPYSSLYAVEYLGDQMISLDFGPRQFVVAGHGLDELSRHLQQGHVACVQQYSSMVWPALPGGPTITAITKMQASNLDG
jgi:hypothetical protein